MRFLRILVLASVLFSLGASGALAGPATGSAFAQSESSLTLSLDPSSGGTVLAGRITGADSSVQFVTVTVTLADGTSLTQNVDAASQWHFQFTNIPAGGWIGISLTEVPIAIPQQDGDNWDYGYSDGFYYPYPDESVDWGAFPGYTWPAGYGWGYYPFGYYAWAAYMFNNYGYGWYWGYPALYSGANGIYYGILGVHGTYYAPPYAAARFGSIYQPAYISRYPAYNTTFNRQLTLNADTVNIYRNDAAFTNARRSDAVQMPSRENMGVARWSGGTPPRPGARAQVADAQANKLASVAGAAAAAGALGATSRLGAGGAGAQAAHAAAAAAGAGGGAAMAQRIAASQPAASPFTPGDYPPTNWGGVPAVGGGYGYPSWGHGAAFAGAGAGDAFGGARGSFGGGFGGGFRGGGGGRRAPVPQPYVVPFRTAHVDLVVRVETNRGNVTIPVTGEVERDPAGIAPKARLHLDAQDAPVDLILVDRHLYIKEGNGPWQVLDLTSLGEGAAPVGQPLAQIEANDLATLSEVGPERIGNTSTTKWALDFDSGRISDFVLDRPELLGGRFHPGGAAAPEEIAALLSGMQMRGELWVANDTNVLRQIRLTQRFTIPQDSSGVLAGLTSMSLDSRLTFSRINRPVRITAPTGAVPLTALAGSAVAPGRPAAPALGQPVPVRQLPRGAAATAPMPQRMPHTGDLLLWPFGGLGLALLGAGVGLRRWQLRRDGRREN